MNSQSRTQNTILNLFSGFGGQFAQLLLKFITRTVFISNLGSSYLGINGLFADILTLLSISELGFDTAINYKLYKPLAENDEYRLRILIKFYKKIYRIVGTIILILGLCLIPFLRYIIKDYNSLEQLNINIVLVFCLYLFQSVSSYWFFSYKATVVRADQKSYLLNLAQITVTFISNIIQIAVLLIFENFILYTIILIAFTIIENYVYSVIAKKKYPHVFKKETDSISKDESTDILKDCGALFIYKVNGVVTRATDNILLSTFIGIFLVGTYSNYLLVYNTINTLLNRFYEACKASMGNAFAISDTAKSYLLFEIMNFLTFIFYGTATVGIAVVLNEFIDFWLGSEYVLNQPTAIFLGISLLFSGIRNNLGQVRNITGVFKQMWFRPLLGIIINLVVSLILVKPLGISGVLIGTITANVLTNFIVDPRVIYKHSFHNFKPVSCYYKRNIGYMILLLFVGCVNFLFCKYLVLPNKLFSLIMHIVICGFSVPICFILVYRKTDACQYILKKAKNLINKVVKR